MSVTIVSAFIDTTRGQVTLYLALVGVAVGIVVPPVAAYLGARRSGTMRHPIRLATLSLVCVIVALAGSAAVVLVDMAQQFS